jgi:eukaryotic-like serine/threonine-protein kinase
MSPAHEQDIYAIGAKVGQGGMATIHLGWDLRSEAGAAPVAIKLLREEFRASQVHIDMFLDEARISARLEHPHIVRVRDFGIGSHGPYIAMELLTGRCAADVFDELAANGQRVPWQLACWICARVADGLHHAHELREPTGVNLELVHRDVNPSNVFLTRRGGIKLLDFGLARAIGRDAGAAPGTVKGKLAYLAPEQFGNRVVDRRTDIFQLGVTLWELCTGERLFKRDTPAETLRAVMAAAVTSPRKLDPDLPSNCERVILRALANAPDRRFTTAKGFARALDEIIDRMPVAESLAHFLESVFPGEHAREATWLADVARGRMSSRNVGAPTLMPPAPLPGDGTATKVR